MARKPTVTIKRVDYKYIVHINGVLAKPYQASRDCGNMSRRLFVTADYILKLGYYSDNEHDLWKRLDKQDKKHFVPIVAHGSFERQYFVVSPFIKFRRGRKSENHWRTISHLLNKYNLSDVYKTGSARSTDGDPTNWAVSEQGIPVIFDYAE